MNKRKIVLLSLLLCMLVSLVAACDNSSKTERIEMGVVPKEFYLKNEELDVFGGTIKVFDSANKVQTVALTSSMVSDFRSDKSGKITVKVNYDGAQTQFSIFVLPEADQISVSEDSVTTYYFNDEITDGSIKLLAKTDLGDEIINLKREQFSQLSTATIGEKSAEINLHSVYKFEFNYTVKYKVEFVAEAAETKSFVTGTLSTVHEPTFAQRAGYKLEGWYDGDNRFDFSTTITKNMQLKAKWSLVYEMRAQNGTTIEVETAATDVMFEYNGGIIASKYENGKYSLNIGQMMPNTAYKFQFISKEFTHDESFTYLGNEVNNLEELILALESAKPGDSIVLKVNLTVGEGETLTVKDNVFLVIDNSVTLINNGEIICYGKISGTVEGKQPIYREDIPSDDYN